MSAPPTLVVMDCVVPAIGAFVFVPVMSRIAEPARRTFNTIFVAGACGVYLRGGFSVWELIYPLLATPVAYLVLRSYREPEIPGTQTGPPSGTRSMVTASGTTNGSCSFAANVTTLR